MKFDGPLTTTVAAFSVAEAERLEALRSIEEENNLPRNSLGNGNPYTRGEGQKYIRSLGMMAKSDEYPTFVRRAFHIPLVTFAREWKDE